VLVVEDDPTLLEQLTELLEREGYRSVHGAGTVADALLTVATWQPQLLLLDVMLPDGNGFDLLRRVRETSDAPALFLSARDEDLATGEVRRLGAVESTLTAKEHALVKRLNESRGSIVTTDELCRSVYGDEFGYANALAILVRRLREKVEDDPSHPRWVVTVRGLGYRLMREEGR
jgi:DNA-binding response OmpR family regulator